MISLFFWHILQLKESIWITADNPTFNSSTSIHLISDFFHSLANSMYFQGFIVVSFFPTILVGNMSLVV